MSGKEIKTIDCTLTWVGVMPALLLALEEGTPKGKAIARQELMDLARKVDAINQREGGKLVL